MIKNEESLKISPRGCLSFKNLFVDGRTSELEFKKDLKKGSLPLTSSLPISSLTMISEEKIIPNNDIFIFDKKNNNEDKTPT
jgi:hypothetical protein